MPSKDEWYDYPFVERLVEEAPGPAPVLADDQPAWCEYTFEAPALPFANQAADREHAVAYIVGAGDAPTGRRRRTIIGRSAFEAHDDRNHLRPRRA
jgi:hypothetical protein